MSRDHGTELAKRIQEEIAAHVLRVIQCSIEARIHDLAGHPAAAQAASYESATHARAARFAYSQMRNA